MSEIKPQSIRSKAKWVSKVFLIFTLLFSSGLIFLGQESEAARTNRVVKKKRINPAKKRVLKRRNQNTPAGVFALHQNPLFGYGKCLPNLVEPAKTILARNGIDTLRASEQEKAALAKGVAQVERLLGNPLPRHYQYDYQWLEASGAWNSGISRPGFVTVKRPRGSLRGQLTGRMMHELGHRFGHANAGQNYNEYRKHMRGRKCMITTYCGKSLNEEFAEVFEAYVVNPDFLAKHCPDSYAYFKTKLFRNPEALNVSCEDPNSVLEHGQDEDDDDPIEESDEKQIDERKDLDDVLLPETGPLPLPDPRRVSPIGTDVPPQEQTVIEPATASVAPTQEQPAPPEVPSEPQAVAVEPSASPAIPAAVPIPKMRPEK